MSDQDQLHRFIIENTRVRGEMVHLRDTWQRVLERYDYPPNVRSILGEAFAACALLSATIKYDGSLILQITGDGPLNLLVVQATSAGTMRGLARWQGEDVPAQDLQAIFGDGQMLMTIKAERGEPYQGIITLQGRHIKDAIEGYFIQSEQLNTRLWLASDQQQCAGFLLQELPLAEDQNSDHDNGRHNWENAELLANTLSHGELLSLSTEDILHRLFHEEDIRLFEPSSIRFSCDCSRERISQMILSLGQAEARQIVEQQGKIQVHCEFCNAEYSYDSIDVESLFASGMEPENNSPKH